MQHFSWRSSEQSYFSFRTTSSRAVGEVGAEPVEEEGGAEGRPRPVVRLPWGAAARAPEPPLDPLRALQLDPLPALQHDPLPALQLDLLPALQLDLLPEPQLGRARAWQRNPGSPPARGLLPAR